MRLTDKKKHIELLYENKAKPEIYSADVKYTVLPGSTGLDTRAAFSVSSRNELWESVRAALLSLLLW